MTRTIALKGEFIRKEAEASAAIKPGHLIEFGGANDVQVHSTSGGHGRRAFALENDLVGGGYDDAYAQGDTVQYGVFPQGAEVYAVLKQGQNVTTKGTALVSGGNGELIAIVTEPQQDSIIAYAMEAVNATSAAARIRVEVA